MIDDKSPVKDQILHLLKMQGAQTATRLAEQIHVSPMAIRQHLQTLKAKSWVTYQEEHRALGRPVKLWQLTPQSNDRFPDRHVDLSLDLLRSTESAFGPKGLEQLMAERRHRQIQTYRHQLAEGSASGNWQQRVWAMAHLRSQEGYMAEVIEQADQTLLLVENHCPICIAAQACQKLCTTELEVFRSVLGKTVTVERIEHILQGDRRCAYRITG
ncbi:helix-turn-helix transcriptional regulator [Egbenema bharatensis]|uniref:helix-turn-helix transcriptional regulator n=1 Tax=Egbenema bharatensis TaxID=3463334 RepID=UPI003A87CBB9